MTLYIEQGGNVNVERHKLEDVKNIKYNALSGMLNVNDKQIYIGISKLEVIDMTISQSNDLFEQVKCPFLKKKFINEAIAYYVCIRIFGNSVMPEYCKECENNEVSCASD